VPNERQPSFAAGEFSPTMWGRTDFQKYAIGARRLYNFFVTPHGGAMNRAGTYFVGETKSSGQVRLLPFTFSDEDSMILAFGDYHFRIYQQDPATGLPGVVTDGTGAPFEFPTPYAAADLARLRFAQMGDIITFVHPSYPAQELSRTSSDNLHWTMAPVSFDVKAFPNIGGVYIRPPMSDSAANPDATTYPAKQWIYKATAICQDASGRAWETAPWVITEQRYDYWTARIYAAGERVWWAGQNWETQSGAGVANVPGDGSTVIVQVGTDVDGNPIMMPVPAWNPLGAWAMPTMFPRYANKQQTLYAPSTTVLGGDPGYRILSFRIYCGRGSVFGYIGELTDGVLVDTGETPDFSTPPPSGTNPFKVYDYLGNLQRTENPVTVCYYEGRRVFGGTTQRPTRIWASAVDDFTNFDEVFPAKDSDSLNFACAAQRFEQVRAIVPRKQLLSLTACSEWLIAGAGLDTVLSPSSIAAHPVTEFGSSWLAPLSLANAVLFLQRKGSLPKALLWEQNAWTPTDLSILSRHLFQSRQVVEWAYAEDPWSVVWCVMSDGKLAALTYVREHELVAWTQHELPGGVVESVCSIPEGLEDAVYFVVRRTINGQDKRYVERLNSRLVTGSWGGIFLDAAVTYRGPAATTFSGLDHLEGQTVVALANGNVVRLDADGNPLVVTGGAVTLPLEDGASVCHIGLPYRSEFESLDSPQDKGRQKTVSRVLVEMENSRGAKVGESLDGKLAEWRQREVHDSYGNVKLFSGAVHIPVVSQWNVGGRCAVMQDEPLPLSLIAVTREVEFGGS
jgi:hypothetical protein